MLKFAMLSVAAGLMVAPVAQAQTIDFGRGGPQLDLRSNAQRDRDYRRSDMRRDRQDRYDRRDLTTGSVRGCRSVTVRERDPYGRMVSRTRRDC